MDKDMAGYRVMAKGDGGYALGAIEWWDEKKRIRVKKNQVGHVIAVGEKAYWARGGCGRGKQVIAEWAVGEGSRRGAAVE